MGNRSWARWFAANASTALLYAGLGYLALMVTRGTGLASPIWPAAGLAFALLYQHGPRLLPGIALGSFVNNAISLRQSDAAWLLIAFVAVVIAVGSVAQAWVGRVLVQRIIGRRVSLVGPSQIITFLLVSGPLACLVNSTLGTTAQVSAGFVPQTKSFIVWMTWWVGDSLGVVIFGPIVLMLLSSNREAWRRRRLFVAAPALAAVIAGVAIFLQGAALEKKQTDLELSTLADEASNHLLDEMHRVTEVLHGVRGLYASTPYVTAQGFRTFTQDALLRDKSLQAISWNPWLLPGELDAFVARQRQAEGFLDYRITEKSASNGFVPAGVRDRYVVVGYIEPLSRNTLALGYDIGSDPVRNRAIQRAVATGKAAATAPVALVQEAGSQQGFLVLVPMFETAVAPATAQSRAQQIRGFAVGVYRCGDLLDAAFDEQRWDGVSISLADITAAGRPTVMADRLSDATGGTSPTLTRTLHFGGRTWLLSVTEAKALVSPSQLVNSPIVMLLGLTMALLLMTFLLLVSGMEHQARTDAELDPLTGLHNRRALLTRLETARRRSQLTGSTHVLLFLDLDGLKRVNDAAGHDVGDRLLQSFAESLLRVVREQDTVARIGGDEFAVVLLDCGVDRGLAIAHEILDAVAGIGTGPTSSGLRAGVSIGLVEITGPDPQAGPDLLRASDHACYAVKRRGGNDALVFDPSMEMRA